MRIVCYWEPSSVEEMFADIGRNGKCTELCPDGRAKCNAKCYVVDMALHSDLAINLNVKPFKLNV